MSEIQRYEAHANDCDPHICNGCGYTVKDEMGDLVSFTDYAALAASHARLVEALENLIPWAEGHADLTVMRLAKEALADAKKVQP